MELTSEESAIVIGLHRMVSDLDHKTAQICKTHGLTLGQFAVLEALYHKGDLTVGELKESVLSTDGTIPVIIGNLEKRSLVTRTQAPEDRRKFIISLTDKGRELACETMPENNQVLKEQLSILTKEDRKLLLEMILRCRQAQRRGIKNQNI